MRCFGYSIRRTKAFVGCLLQKVMLLMLLGNEMRIEDRLPLLIVKHLNEQSFWSLIKNMALDRFVPLRRLKSDIIYTLTVAMVMSSFHIHIKVF